MVVSLPALLLQGGTTIRNHAKNSPSSIRSHPARDSAEQLEYGRSMNRCRSQTRGQGSQVDPASHLLSVQTKTGLSRRPAQLRSRIHPARTRYTHCRFDRRSDPKNNRDTMEQAFRKTKHSTDMPLRGQKHTQEPDNEDSIGRPRCQAIQNRKKKEDELRNEILTDFIRETPTYGKPPRVTVGQIAAGKSPMPSSWCL